MKRITISVPDEVAAAIDREARRRRLPVSQVIRERLADISDGEHGRRSIPFAAIGRSGHTDTARNVDVLLNEWAHNKSRAGGR
jgi:predicted transcriptional regulator